MAWFTEFLKNKRMAWSILIVVFLLLGGLFGLTAHSVYSGKPVNLWGAEWNAPTDTAKTRDKNLGPTISNNKTGDNSPIINGSANNINSPVNNYNYKEKSGSHPKTLKNQSKALIVTNNQSGGQNTVNIYQSKLNPANDKKLPLFDVKGFYGPNILDPNITVLSKDIFYSLSANIPDDTKLKIALMKVDKDDTAIWWMSIGSKQNWKYTPFLNNLQEYFLEDAQGDLKIVFQGAGEAILKIYFNDGLFLTKTIRWN